MGRGWHSKDECSVSSVRNAQIVGDGLSYPLLQGYLISFNLIKVEKIDALLFAVSREES